MGITKTQLIAIGANKNLSLAKRVNALYDYLTGTNSFKEFTALFTQSSTGAPTMEILKNELDGTPVAAYSNTGLYTLTLEGAWPDNETSIEHPGVLNADTESSLSVVRTDADVITINTATAGTNANGLLNDTKITIQVPAE